MSITQPSNRGGSFCIDFRVNGKRIRRKSPVQTLEGAHAFELELQRKYLGIDEVEIVSHNTPILRTASLLNAGLRNT